MGGEKYLEQRRSLSKVRQLLHQQTINIADVKLSNLLGWVSKSC